MTRNDKAVYVLQNEYQTPGGQNLSWRHGNANLTACGWNAGTAQAYFPYFWGRWSALGRNSTDFMGNTFMTAAIMDAIWAHHANIFSAPCQSRAHIIIPMGKYYITFPMDLHFGIYEGHGTSEFYTNSVDFGGTFGQGGTSLWIDHNNWFGDNNSGILESTTWGNESLFGYNESFIVRNLRLNGNKRSEIWQSDRMTSCVKVWDAGSASKFENVFLDNCEGPAAHFVRGTFAKAANFSVFRSNYCGIYLQGGGQFVFDEVESDECPAVFRTEKGFSRPASASLSVRWLKTETGPAPSRPRGLGMAVGDFHGWIDAHFGMINYSAVNSLPYTLFRVDADMDQNGTLGDNSSRVTVDHFRLFGPCYAFMHDVYNRKLFLNHASPGGPYNKNGYWQTELKDFTWEAKGGGRSWHKFGRNATVITNVATNRLAPLEVDPWTGNATTVFDPVAGTPDYIEVPDAGSEGAVQPPGTPVLPPAVANNITVAITPLTFTIPATAQATVTVLNQYGAPMAAAGAWSVLSGNATISPTGVISGLSGGVYTIAYTQGGAVGTATVTGTGGIAPPPPPTPCTYTIGPWGPCINGVRTRSVTPNEPGCVGTPPVSQELCTVIPPPTPVASGAVITLASSTVPVGTQVQATVTVTDQNGLPMTPNGTWSVTGPGTINAVTGLIQTTGPGTITVSYQQQNANQSAALQVTAVAPPSSLLYQISFQGNNPAQLTATVGPNCMPITDAQAFYRGTITNGRLTTTRNTVQILNNPVAGVRRIVLKNAVVLENGDWFWLNNKVRTRATRQYFLDPAGTLLGPGPFTVNGSPADITIILPSAQTITRLFGGGVGNDGAQITWTQKISCTGVEFYNTTS